MGRCPSSSHLYCAFSLDYVTRLQGFMQQNYSSFMQKVNFLMKKRHFFDFIIWFSTIFENANNLLSSNFAAIN